jgi:hypothetical protein
MGGLLIDEKIESRKSPDPVPLIRMRERTWWIGKVLK